MGRLASWAATDCDQSSRLQGSQAVTDIALVTSQGLHQFEMSGANAALGALILSPHRDEDLTLQFRKPPCRHENALESGASRDCAGVAWANLPDELGLALSAVIVIHTVQIGEIEVIMRSEGSMSSVFR